MKYRNIFCLPVAAVVAPVVAAIVVGARAVVGAAGVVIKSEMLES